MSLSRQFWDFHVRPIIPMMTLLMVVVFALVACGGGDSDKNAKDDERANALANSPALQTIEARGGISTPASASTVAPSPTPVREMTMDEAQKQLWLFLSKCITLDTSDIEAVQVEGNWYVRGMLDSNHETGLWEVPNVEEPVQPYDQRAKDWLETIEGNCSQEKMLVMTTPIPPTPVVSGAASASAAVWGFLVRCASELSKDNVNAQENPLESEWIVTTDKVFVEALGREVSFGVWSVSYDGVVTRKDTLAQVWYAYVLPTKTGGECASAFVPNILYNLPSPTPVATSTAPTQPPAPTPTARIQGSINAETSVWAYLVPCFSNVKVSDFKATFDSSNSIWVVVQTDGATVSTWSVSNNGIIKDTNSSAKQRREVVTAGSC